MWKVSSQVIGDERLYQVWRQTRDLRPGEPMHSGIREYRKCFFRQESAAENFVKYLNAFYKRLDNPRLYMQNKWIDYLWENGIFAENYDQYKHDIVFNINSQSEPKLPEMSKQIQHFFCLNTNNWIYIFTKTNGGNLNDR